MSETIYKPIEDTLPCPWRQRLHNRNLSVVDKIYELLTGRDPNEE